MRAVFFALVTATLTAASLGGCAVVTSDFAASPAVHLRGFPVTTDSHASRLQPDDHTIYVGECGYYGSDCNLYSNGNIIATLTSKDGMSNPEGTIADPATGDWLIANTAASNILLYDTTGGKPVLDATLSDAGEYPVAVATIDAGKGTLKCVVVSNIFTTGGSAGSLSVMCGKKTTTLTTKDAYQGLGVATDGKGNCYWSFNTSSNTNEVVEFAACKGKAKVIPGINGSAFAIDGKNNLWYSGSNGIYKCNGTKNCVLAFSGVTGPFNFSADFSALYVADTGSGNIEVCAIGGSCTIYAQLNGSDPPFGVAPIPGAH